MSKSEVYRLAIAAVIGNEGLEMGDKIEVLKELFHELGMAEVVERLAESEEVA